MDNTSQHLLNYNSEILLFCLKGKRLADYENLLLTFGINLTLNDWHRISGLLNGWNITTFFEESFELNRLGNSWRYFLDTPTNRTEQNNKDRLVIFGIILFLLETRKEETAEILLQNGLRYYYTRREDLLRLCSCLFSLGSITIKQPNYIQQGRNLFIELIAITKEIIIEKLYPKQQMEILGRRGISLLILARKDNNDIALSRLNIAVQDLKKSRELGDETKEHYQNEIEALTRLYILTGELEYLSYAEILCERVLKLQQTPEILTVLGDVKIASAKYYEREGNINKALEQLVKAVSAFKDSIKFAGSRQNANVYYMRLARTQMKLYTLSNKFEHKLEVENDLDNILTNFERAGTLAFTEGSNYSTALLFKSDELIKYGQYFQAIELIDRALTIPQSIPPTEEETNVHYRLIITKTEAEIRLSIENDDRAKVFSSLDFLLSTTKLGDISVAVVAQAIRYLINNGASFDNPIFERVLDAIKDNIKSEKHSGDAVRFAASNAGSLIISIYGLSQYDRLAEAHSLFRLALDAGVTLPPPELLGWLATTSFFLAEKCSEEGDDKQELAFLEDARDFYLQVIDQLQMSPSEQIDISVIHSKLSILYLHIQNSTGNLSDAEEAVKHMEAAISLDGNYPARYGHLGDAYYRVGRIKRDPRLLKNAIKYKRLARDDRPNIQGDKTRENRSVTAAALIRLWNISKNQENLIDAIKENFLAIQIDPKWPWSYFQLADIIEMLGIEELKYLAIEKLPSYINSSLNQFDFEARNVLLKGCELAVNTIEFERKNLGGRKHNQVHVLNDPHNLLNQSVVFKLNLENVAVREQEVINSLSKNLKRLNAPSYFSHTEPIGVVIDSSGKEWYATRFQKGRDLGRIIYSDPNGSIQIVENSVEFLAIFHLSGGILLPNDPEIVRQKRDFWFREIKKNFENFDTSSLKLSAEVAKLVPENILYCPKKDAHPENWMVTPNKKIVMMDFESTRKLPILYEVAQLLEDYPAITISDEGWRRRILLCQSYLKTIYSNLNADVIQYTLSYEEIEKIYSVFALTRAVFGLERVFRKNSNPLSSSALRLLHFRETHYLNLINAFSNGWGFEAISSLANVINSHA